MSYPPYRNQYEGSYDRDAERRRGRGDDERDLRQRGEREGQRFRRDYSESFENEDRPFPGRERGQFGGQYEDWEQPRRFGSESGREGGRWGQGEQSEWQQPSRRFGTPRNEWQSQPQRYGRFGEGGGYFDEGSRYGESGRYERFGEGGFDESRRQRFGSESSDFGGERGSWGGLGRRSESGQFAGRGPKNYRRSDQRIQEEVCDRLTSDPQVDASEIQVSVKDGEITLEGTVGERRMKRLAEDCAESVAGVNQVHNRLRVEEEGAGRSQSQGREQGKEGQTSQSSTRQSSGRSSAI
jgi:osmotically-inducible protein OsmY